MEIYFHNHLYFTERFASVDNVSLCSQDLSLKHFKGEGASLKATLDITPPLQVKTDTLFQNCFIINNTKFSDTVKETTVNLNT
jgi:hypothetical protein